VTLTLIHSLSCRISLQLCGQWTFQTSQLAAQVFPNLQFLLLIACAVPLQELMPLLQRAPPLLGIQLRKSQLCPAGRYDYDYQWPMLAIRACHSQHLELKDSFGPEWRELVFPLRHGAKFFSNTLTHLLLDRPGIGTHGNWMWALLHLPALRCFAVTPNGNSKTGSLEVGAGID
jgi:hypothetical protein